MHQLFAQTEPHSWLPLLTLLAFFSIIGFVIWLVGRVHQKKLAEQQEYHRANVDRHRLHIERKEDHMKRVETTLERIANALEQRS